MVFGSYHRINVENNQELDLFNDITDENLV